MYKIGKTPKDFYTLWEVIETVQHSRDSSSYKNVVKNLYICSLGKKEETALKNAEKYGITELEVDEKFERVAGTFWENGDWISLLKEWQFPYGKLKGEDIRKSNDIWQLERQSNEGNQFAKNRLLEIGNYTDHDGKLINSNILFALKQGYIKITPARNIKGLWDGNKFLSTDEFGEINFDKNLNEKLKVFYYNGYEYWLPMDDNGTGKKIKGKICIIRLDNKLDDENRLIGMDFRILSKKEIEMTKKMSII